MQAKTKNKDVILGRIYTLFALFLFGAFFGWAFEVCVYAITDGIWKNPGMLHGTYLPVYGFGAVVLFALSHLPMPIKNKPLQVFTQTLVMAVALTLLEYVAGLLFVRGLGLHLWNYSHHIGNVQGLICPLCSLGWWGLSAVYVLLVHPFALRLKDRLMRAKGAQFFLAFLVCVILLDFVVTVLSW